MFVLNEQAKETRDIFTRKTIKNIRSNRKKLAASNVKFLQSLDFIEISEMINILNIEDKPFFDDRIIRIETHIQSVRQHHEHSYEIRIPIQQQDLYMLPCESFLNFKRRLLSNEENADQ